VPTTRTAITRHRERGRTDRADLHAVLDAGLVAHVGLVRDGGPVVLPTGYGRDGDSVYLHGSTGAGWLRIPDGTPLCLTVTLLDGIVYARSVFSHSMNYRSAVVFGAARVVTDATEHERALQAIVEHLAPGSWDHARRPTSKELAATAVIAVDLAEASVKVRCGPPADDEADVTAGSAWAGVLPLTTAAGAPQPCPALDPAVPVPPHVSGRF
jgi:uncharacterized protein